FYQKICSNLAPLNPVGITASNQLIKQAYEFFSKPMSPLSGSELGELIENISAKMLFTKIVVRDILNAYKLFETLNARGVQLSTPDLLKNYLFSVITSNDDVPDEQVNELDEDWLNILTQLRENNFSDFIRHQHNIQNHENRNLFRSLKQIADTPQSASQYLKSLTEYAPVYASLLNPHDEWWKTQNNAHHKISYYLQGLKLFTINQPFPVLMVACQKFSPEEFLKTLKYLYVLSVRYNIICRLSPNEQKRAYNKMAMKVFNGEHTRASHIKNSEEFRRLYPDDNAFKNAFEFYKMPSRRSSKQIRFLLAEIENSFGRELNYLDTTLEHVCPYNHDQAWYEYFGEGVNDIADRLGNMVLLEKDELRRADFKTKKGVYLSTSFRLAKKVAEYDSWDLATLSHYQIWLAKQAVKTWKVE
ncbi:MAG: HNH endonuclease family protein, partial [Pseudomonadota bacterium]